MRFFPAIVISGLVVLAGVSCRRDEAAGTAVSSDVVAVVGSRPVSRAAFEKELARRGPDVSKEVVLGEMIRFETTLAKLKGTGFDRDPEIVAAMERMLVARFEERELAGSETPAVTDGEIRDRYSANATDYRIPAAVRGAFLFLKCSPKAVPEARARVARSAGEILARARSADAAGFERLARENSEDQPTRYKSGDMGWLEVGRADRSYDPAVTEALFALQTPGDFAPLIETPAGFYVVKLSEARPEGIRPLVEVAEAIRHQIIREKREQLTAAFQTRMRAGLDIRTNLAVFDRALVAVRNDTRPPSVP